MLAVTPEKSGWATPTTVAWTGPGRRRSLMSMMPPRARASPLKCACQYRQLTTARGGPPGASSETSSAPQRGPHAERMEEVPRDHPGADRLAAGRRLRPQWREADHVREHGVAVAILRVVLQTKHVQRRIAGYRHVNCTRLPGSRTGRSRNSSGSTRLKAAVLAPMASVSVAIVTAVKTGARRSVRTP